MATPAVPIIQPPSLTDEDALTLGGIEPPTTSSSVAGVVTAVPVIEPVLAAAAVAPVLAVAATVAVASASLTAETLLPLVQLALASNSNDDNTSQPLLALLSQHRVHLRDDNLAESLVQLDALVAACETALDRHAGLAPGFLIRRHDGDSQDATKVTTKWSAASSLQGIYETLDLPTAKHHRSLPAPSIHQAWFVYQAVRHVLAKRLEFLQSVVDNDDDAETQCCCSCIGKWDHVEGNIAMNLVNQCMEQVCKTLQIMSRYPKSLLCFILSLTSVCTTTITLVDYGTRSKSGTPSSDIARKGRRGRL